jgi:CRISPR-associated protein Cas2
MLVVIAYDIEDDRKRNRAAKLLEGYGERVQESVFECWLSQDQLTKAMDRMARIIDQECDRVRYYRMCRKDSLRVDWDGRGEAAADKLAYVV